MLSHQHLPSHAPKWYVPACGMLTARAGMLLVAFSAFRCGGTQTARRAGLPPGVMCRAGRGLNHALPVCSPERPCAAGRVFADGRLLRRDVNAVSGAPTCQTTNHVRPFADDGDPEAWRDAAGNTRYACAHHPPSGAAGAAPVLLPLVVFFPPAYGAATTMYDETSLVGRTRTFDLTGDPSRAGFVLVGLHPRTLHWPSGRDGTHFDHYHRDLARNPDVQFVDHVIDAAVAAGGIDPQRIYLMGWSNGGTFAAYYGIARHESPTAGGQRVAAAAVYAGSDPYENVFDGQTPSCAVGQYPHSSLPMYLLQRSCDAMTACGPAQRADFGGTPGADTESWAHRLSADVGDPAVTLQLIDGRGGAVNQCTFDCTQAEGTRNHLRWPDGVSDVSGHDWESTLLGFLRDHPLGAGATTP